MNNPYLEEYENDKALWKGDFEGAARMFTSRSRMVREYAWAIPNTEAINTLVSLSKIGEIVELGAGCGYWAHLVQNAGGKITPWDLYPNEKNKYSSHQTPWTQVHEGSVEVLESLESLEILEKSYPTLLLCWPPCDSPFAHQALQAFQGSHLVYVGEGPGGCCANDEFFTQLAEKWSLEKTIAIPQWPGIHDRFQLWKKKI